MSYPAPPGYNPSRQQAPPPASLPARPPPSTAATTTSANFKPAYNNNNASSSDAGGYSAFTAFAPRSVAAASTGPNRTHSPVVSATPSAYAPPSTGGYGNQYPAQYGQQATHYSAPQSYSADAYSAPTIRNPFVAPGQDQPGYNNRNGQAPGYDPELEAQIAQWQSAYSGNDDSSNAKSGGNRYGGGPSATGANTGALGSRSDASTPAAYAGPSAAPSTTSAPPPAIAGPQIGPQATVVRSGGGQQWTDSSLLEWDPAHFRLFVGNLAGEVTDDSLLKAFSKYPSVQKARVIRDKRTTKSKGYGFVSFADGDEYFRAAREMQGKYIGSHPVLLRRSTTEIRPTTNSGKGGKGNYKGKGGHGGGGGGGGSGKVQHGGVQKKSGKTKGGLKVLG